MGSADRLQPEFDLRSDRLVGAEALLRWNHPRLGVINAAEFIEDLERFELIDKLLPLIIDEATSFAQYYAESGFTIRINLGAEQLVDPALLRLMSRAVDQAPDLTFCLEVTERSAIAMPNPA